MHKLITILTLLIPLQASALSLHITLVPNAITDEKVTKIIIWEQSLRIPEYTPIVNTSIDSIDFVYQFPTVPPAGTCWKAQVENIYGITSDFSTEVCLGKPSPLSTITLEP